jgi:hypothetical protein
MVTLTAELNLLQKPFAAELLGVQRGDSGSQPPPAM